MLIIKAKLNPRPIITRKN